MQSYTEMTLAKTNFKANLPREENTDWNYGAVSHA